jgi:hypothetical protein
MRIVGLVKNVDSLPYGDGEMVVAGAGLLLAGAV